jgi:hypothetical protein
MPALFDFLYREYCRARLAEMRKQLLLRRSHGMPESACDPDDADVIGTNGPGDEQEHPKSNR